jgi:hypothetical protein
MQQVGERFSEYQVAPKKKQEKTHAIRHTGNKSETLSKASKARSAAKQVFGSLSPRNQATGV